ncbi:MAG: ArsB/NhaD family transporter [Thermoanaerobacterales bacterium]|nr:ArsB/NhaD family transporter [Bacillota bacterium]MDI6906375.1 ArsB/NhaD family transporter [Thermoanaerobacterales bacterium]
MEGNQAALALTVFAVTYALVVSERLHRAVAAMGGAAVVVFTGLLDQDEAVAAIDFNTLGLLIGMMVIVTITRETGLFEYLAVRAARVARGEPVRILVGLGLVTAVLSAFLDNVTAVFLIVPVTFALTRRLQLSAIPFLITEILASNIGGTATLIGDPPNIMISAPAGLGFVDFLANLAPIATVVLIVTTAILYFLFRPQLHTEPELKKKILAIEPRDYLHDRRLLRQSLLVLGLTLAGFILHQYIHLPAASIALGGATVLLIVTRKDPEKPFRGIEWPTLFFFAGLFVIVGALEATGVMERAARAALDLTGGRLLATGMALLWVSALASGLVDNIPFVAAMIPLLQEMGRLGAVVDLDPWWWSLALGACLGGNGTLVGAAANVIVAGLAEKNGTPIGFWDFFRYGFPLMLLSVALAAVYLIIFHLRG